MIGVMTSDKQWMSMLGWQTVQQNWPLWAFQGCRPGSQTAKSPCAESSGARRPDLLVPGCLLSDDGTHWLDCVVFRPLSTLTFHSEKPTYWLLGARTIGQGWKVPWVLFWPAFLEKQSKMSFLITTQEEAFITGPLSSLLEIFVKLCKSGPWTAIGKLVD